MSFLTEVPSSAQEYDTHQLLEKLPAVTSEVEIYRDSVIKFLDSVYVRLGEQSKNKGLLLQSEVLSSDLTQLMTTAEELNKKDLAASSQELAQTRASLEKASATLHIVIQLTAAHKALQNAARLRSHNRYLEAMKSLINTRNCLESVPAEERVKAVNKLITVIETEQSSLLTEVERALSDNIKTDTVLKVCREKKDTIAELLLVSELSDDSIQMLDGITNFLWNNVLVPIVDDGATVKTHEDNGICTLYVSKPEKCDVYYVNVFENIEKVLTFLCDNVNYPLEKHKSTLSYIGRDLRDNLSELLIKQCLQKMIPSTNEGLQKFEAVIKRTEHLHEELVRAGIFTREFVALIEYVKNVDTLFINKKCEEYTAEAVALMKKDLHNMAEVSENSFPKCAVSKSCIALLQLAEKLLQQCLSTSEMFSERIVYTVQNIFYTYKSFVPEYHRKLLETIPQQVALFHNNCLYIAHRLTEWNETKFPQKLFPDHPDLLMSTGKEIFSSYVEQQVAQIEAIMRDSGLDALQTAEHLQASVEKSVRQCLRQQELLKTVWQKVLSCDIYNKSMGMIMNSLCLYLIQATLKVEDIPSTLDEQLVEVYKVVVGRGPKLFADPREICLFVKNWNKFNELIFVLSASLVDIDDRWSNGKGPLALEFQPEEVRKLIRALFQNTDRRAQVLLKIRD